MNRSDTTKGYAQASVAPAVNSEKRASYFGRHWRGELSLGISYWVDGVLLGWALVLVGAIVSSAALLGLLSLMLTAAFSLALWPLTVFLSVWQLVGIWRSASNHVSRGGAAAWAMIAQFIVVISVLACPVLVYTSYIPQSAELLSILGGDTRLPSYQIRVVSAGTEIVFRGGLRAGCATELKRVLSGAKQVKMLEIESPGGRVGEAEQMARLVREYGLITYSSKYCLSAATLMLMSGKDRVVAPGAKIGLHAGTTPGITAFERLLVDNMMRMTMRSAGVTDEFIKRVVATPPNQMWYPTFEEMREAGVVDRQSHMLSDIQ